MDGGTIFFVIIALLWAVGGAGMLMTGGGSSQTTLCGIALLVLGIGTLIWVFKDGSKQEQASSSNNTTVNTSSSAVRSEWEKRVARMVRDAVPYGVNVVENDRSVIPGRNGSNYEIDIFVPSLGLGFEANGEHWHDHDGYLADKRYGTTYTDEMYKERECAKRSIELVHVWDSQSDDQIRQIIQNAVSRHR